MTPEAKYQEVIFCTQCVLAQVRLLKAPSGHALKKGSFCRVKTSPLNGRNSRKGAQEKFWAIVSLSKCHSRWERGKLKLVQRGGTDCGMARGLLETTCRVSHIKKGCPGRAGLGQLGQSSGTGNVAAGSFLFSSSRVKEEIVALLLVSCNVYMKSRKAIVIWESSVIGFNITCSL